MIQIIKKCDKKNFFLTFVSQAAAEYKNRDLYFEMAAKIIS